MAKKFEIFLKEHPKVSLKVAVAEANRVLKIEGISADIFFAEPQEWILAKDRGWKILPPKKTNPCDQRIATVAVVRSQEKSVTLPTKNQSVAAILPEGAHLSKVALLPKDSREVFTTFYVPFVTAPMGASQAARKFIFAIRSIMPRPAPKLVSSHF